MKKYSLFAFNILFVLFSGCECTKPCQGDLAGLESSAMVIYPFNIAMDNYFYPEVESQSSFKRDSLQVINEDGRRFPAVRFLLKADPRNQLNRFYAVDVAPAFIIPDDNSAFNAEKTRKIYLQYNYNTADTLTLVFKAKKNKM
jgi:hypothetical protein